jgi:hypothetical protein
MYRVEGRQIAHGVTLADKRSSGTGRGDATRFGEIHIIDTRYAEA